MMTSVSKPLFLSMNPIGDLLTLHLDDSQVRPLLLKGQLSSHCPLAKVSKALAVLERTSLSWKNEFPHSQPSSSPTQSLTHSRPGQQRRPAGEPVGRGDRPCQPGSTSQGRAGSQFCQRVSQCDRHTLVLCACARRKVGINH